MSIIRSLKTLAFRFPPIENRRLILSLEMLIKFSWISLKFCKSFVQALENKIVSSTICKCDTLVLFLSIKKPFKLSLFSLNKNLLKSSRTMDCKTYEDKKFSNPRPPS
ncbi:hypothetical protein CK203_052054 [Vitis vinifera]|uniref:Uncharacterized protein n=1 Tax=Vitis vinifera TaxID=29760 RepID=A0A438GR23_VITVI|nr:hypothetical protein CK203_052054 [Vitis vinifera]